MFSNNLFYNLPEVIQSEIYQYDNTYRIFGTAELTNELSGAYLKSKSSRSKCVTMITTYLSTVIHDGGAVWKNEYGRIDPTNEFSTTLPNYRSTEDFFVVLHLSVMGDVIYYKILPTGSTEETCEFLEQPEKYDGYFVDENTNVTAERLNSFDKMCTEEAQKIESLDSNNNVISNRIALYFC